MVLRWLILATHMTRVVAMDIRWSGRLAYNGVQKGCRAKMGEIRYAHPMLEVGPHINTVFLNLKYILTL